LLWETTMIKSGNATPATYQIDGKQYVVIPAFGGYERPAPGGRGRGAGSSPDVGAGGPSGGVFVAFAVP